MPSPRAWCLRHVVMRIAVAVVAALAAACSGDDGSAGPPGSPGVGVTGKAESLTVTVNRVTIASPPAVEFTLTNEDGIRFVGLPASRVRFTLAKLVPGANGNPSAWQSYINRTETPTVGPGTEPKIQGTSENNGTLVSHGDGTYTYTFATNVTTVTSPLAVAYEPGLTHRLAIQISGGDLPVANGTYTWRPSDGATAGLLQRDIVQTASCNECHGKLAIHGGGRVEAKYCVTCHNPGSTDANSGNTVDFKVMIHKIHRGEELPSVVAGGEYAIWGFGNTKHDYSDVVLPQDIRNCTKCHDAADATTPQGGNWETQPSVEACGSCHDDVDFATGANHSPSQFVAQNGECTVCHSPDGFGTGFAGSVADSHAIPSKIAGAKYKFTIVSGTNTAPGQFPVVIYKVTNPISADAAYNVMTDSKIASLSLLLGWDNRDHHNEGYASATTPPASAVTLNGKAASAGNNAAPVNNGDGTFTVTSLRAIPANVTGSGVVGMTGRAAEDLNGDGDTTDVEDRIPVKSVVSYFPITDASAVPRRQVVDIVKQCDLCHDQLTIHGDSRTDEPQLCVICHNANNTDINRRPKNPDGTVNIAATLDGKKEESIHFKTMIHGIHSAGFREKGLVVWGFGPTQHDFGNVRFPGILNNCRTCHKPNTFTLPLADGVLATTIDTGASRSDPNDDINVTPTAAACSACHDGSLAKTHMEQNGASFSMVGDPGSYDETCAICHGPGRLADVAEVHDVTP